MIRSLEEGTRHGFGLSNIRPKYGLEARIYSSENPYIALFSSREGLDVVELPPRQPASQPCILQHIHVNDRAHKNRFAHAPSRSGSGEVTFSLPNSKVGFRSPEHNSLVHSSSRLRVPHLPTHHQCPSTRG